SFLPPLTILLHQNWISVQLLANLIHQLQARELQQPDGLLQLRRHDQLLGQLELLFEFHQIALNRSRLATRARAVTGSESNTRCGPRVAINVKARPPPAHLGQSPGLHANSRPRRWATHLALDHLATQSPSIDKSRSKLIPQVRRLIPWLLCPLCTSLPVLDP